MPNPTSGRCPPTAGGKGARTGPAPMDDGGGGEITATRRTVQGERARRSQIKASYPSRVIKAPPEHADRKERKA